MSFGKLKAARKVKEVHSFVVPPSPAERQATTLNVDVLHITEPQTDGGKAASEALLLEDSANESFTNEARELIHQTVDQATGISAKATEAPSGSPAKSTNDTKQVFLYGCHAALPHSLEIRESAQRGRGIYTKSVVHAGSVVMAVVPHATVLSSQYLDQYCSACAAPPPVSGLKRCPKCKTVYYCNQLCQNRDWTQHKHECSALQKWAAAAPSQEMSVPGDAIRCLGRILWTSRKEGLDSPWAKEIRMMQSNRTAIQPSSFESHAQLAHFVVRYLDVNTPAELEPYGLGSAGDLVDLISRFTTNTFTITSSALTPIGICIAPTIAFANHSCDPNAVIVFPRAPGTTVDKEPSMNLVALRDIPQGKEIRIAYVDTTLPKRLRRRELQDTYHFKCLCKLCIRSPAVDPRDALWCPKNCGGTCPIPTEEDNISRCQKCRTAVTDADAVLDAVRVGQEALDKATLLQFKDPAKSRQLTTNIIPILISAGLMPSSHPLLAMTHLHQELLIASLPSSPTQDSLDDVIRTAAKYCAGLQGLLPKGHPVRAVALGELGKLLAVDEPASRTDAAQASATQFPPSGPARLKLAYETLVRAHEELVIGFGKENRGGQVGVDVHDAAVRLEQELGVWTTGIKNALNDTMDANRAR
ncbi:SET domain-containing protein [Trametes meyenii]|nr:SET domain-containing protein [Trametes meyenii]